MNTDIQKLSKKNVMGLTLVVGALIFFALGFGGIIGKGWSDFVAIASIVLMLLSGTIGLILATTEEK